LDYVSALLTLRPKGISHPRSAKPPCGNSPLRSEIDAATTRRTGIRHLFRPAQPEPTIQIKCLRLCGWLSEFCYAKLPTRIAHAASCIYFLLTTQNNDSRRLSLFYCSSRQLTPRVVWDVEGDGSYGRTTPDDTPCFQKPSTRAHGATYTLYNVYVAPCARVRLHIYASRRLCFAIKAWLLL